MKSRFIILLSFFLSCNVFAHGMSEADKAKALEASYFDYIELGAGHMLTGYDHLLFLLGVIFFLSRFMDVVKFITAFTIGHSITLVFATLYHIQASYFLVDAVIALTVVYKGFDNLDGFKKYLDVKAPSLLWMVFAFGLIHGFGLSTRLQMLPLAEEGLVLRILAFNVGVELGQILALTVMLVVLAGWRKTASFKKFSHVANSGLILIGFLLFLMQMHGYQHATFSDEFPLNRDDHVHLHEDWNAAEPMIFQTPLDESQSASFGAPAPLSDQPEKHSHGDGEPHHH